MCRGILLHIWGEDVFFKVGVLFGKFIKGDKNSSSSNNFYVGRLFALIKLVPLIDVEVKVKVGSNFYSIWAVEEVPLSCQCSSSSPLICSDPMDDDNLVMGMLDALDEEFFSDDNGSFSRKNGEEEDEVK